MRLIYSKPKPKDLSQGSRIAFARQFRFMTQDDVSDKLGLTGECKRRTMTRYEKGDRNPEVCRTKKIAEILNIIYEAIKRYNYKESIDLIYTLLWMEELLPNYHFDISDVKDIDDEYNGTLNKFLNEWNLMKQKRKSREIRYADYIEWKLTYQIDKEDSNE